MAPRKPRMPSPRHRGLTTMRTVFAYTPVMGNLNRSKRINDTLSKVYSNSAPDPHSILSGGPRPLAFYTNWLMPRGHDAVVVALRHVGG